MARTKERVSVYNKRYYAAHLEEQRTRVREWQRANKHKIDKAHRKIYMTEYYAAHQEQWNRRTPEARAKNNSARKVRYANDPDHRQSIIAKVKEWTQANPLKRKAQRLRQYGITIQQYDAMLAAQGYSCAICGFSGNDKAHFPFVDHDHATGRVRGILCVNCNFVVGHSGDDPAILRKAAAYLEACRG